MNTRHALYTNFRTLPVLVLALLAALVAPGLASGLDAGRADLASGVAAASAEAHPALQSPDVETRVRASAFAVGTRVGADSAVGGILHPGSTVLYDQQASGWLVAADALADPKMLDGLTSSQIDDLARNARYEVLPGRASAANPATRYYLPGTRRSEGFYVLPQGVAGQTGIKGGPYLKFFGGDLHGERVRLR